MTNQQLVAEQALSVGCRLGEGPLWRAEERALWFVDIKQDRIHRWRPATGEHRTWEAPGAPSFLAPLAGGGWMVGLRTGLHRFDPEAGTFELVAAVEDP